MKAVILVLASSLLMGCAPDLWLHTAPPPTTHETRVLSDEIELTEGVGLGFGVGCTFLACGEIRVSTDAPGVARAYLSHVDRKDIGWTLRTKPGVVLVGVSQGTTILHVWDDSHERRVTVKVLAAAQ